ncbi:MFS transporter [Virgisporangium aurantiacum]|uniref:MFS transporter n=1 Tax=Virgisporangium aurantiacum TaxID=175570 RepID=A0A8J3ZGU7_9ACTN|nr:MFS transporter [Virgisporangium aurantiacum]GIJ63629.1 MFS transporter [Virgisporangium aurantiacum]
MFRRMWWTVIALCAAQFVLILDVVIINVAIPVIRSDLGLLDSRVSLTGTAYTLTFGSLLVVAGRAGDRLGRRALLLGGLALFVLASLLAGLSQVDWQLFTARALQGTGAALVSANALAAITASLPEGAERNRALGLWAAVGSAGAIAGQLVGGAVTEFLGWRWIFLINVPIGAAVVVALAVLMRRDADPVRRPLAFGASALLTGGLVSGVLALTWLAEDGVRTRAGLAALIAAVLLGTFVHAERRSAEPLLRLALLRLPGVRTANVTLLLNAGALGATMFFATLYLQVVLGHSAFAVGLAFAPITVVVLVISPRVAALTGRVGVRRPLTAGLVLLVAGALLLARAPVGGSYWADVLPGMLLLALGSALAFAPTFIAASIGVGPDDHGASSGLINSAQEIGAALGLATLALVANWATGPGAGPGALATGYRAGLIGAAACFALAAVVAATTPASLGKTREGAHT